MRTFENVYRIALLESDKKDFAELKRALSIYVKYTASHEKTATNEIEEWFFRYNEEFDDKLMLFSFYLNEEIIGYCEVVFFITKKFIFLDYLTLRDGYQKNNIFYEFFEQVQSYIDSLGLEYDFIITEINYDSDEKPNKENRLWISLLKMQGFHEIHGKYFLPKLGDRNFESESTGELMLYSRSEVKSIKPNTYLNIVETVYYDHYLRWYRPYVANGGAEYEKSLNDFVKEIKLSLQGKKSILVNGYSEILSPSPILRTPNEVRAFKTAIPITFIIVCLSLIVMIASSYFSLSSGSMVLSFLIILSVFFAAVSIYSKDGRHLFFEILKSVISFGSK